MRIIFFNIGTILFLTSTTSSFTPGIIGTSNFKMSSPSSSSRNDNTKLRMNLDGGLEIAEEYATPLSGDMVLYIKPGPDGKGIGDCPFAHQIRMVLHEKNLEYSLFPTSPQNKPKWLIEEYDGSLPALRHRSECYVESNVIVRYLDFFFNGSKKQNRGENMKKDCSISKEENDEYVDLGGGGIIPSKAVTNMLDSIDLDDKMMDGFVRGAREHCDIDGFFPALAGYLKYTGTDEETSLLMCDKLRSALQKIEHWLLLQQQQHEQQLDDGDDEKNDVGPYLCGNFFSLVDCDMAPKLYHMEIGLEAFKSADTNKDSDGDGKYYIDIDKDFPKVRSYMNAIFDRDSFKSTTYPKETVVWGWENARKK